MAAKMVQVQLADAYKKFSGLLNNIYPVKDGVAVVPEDGTHVLETYYGGKVVQPAQAQAQQTETKK